MAPRVGKKRKSADQNLDLSIKCRKCDKNVPACQTSQCSRKRHCICVDCLRIAAENIVFDEADNFDHERKGINCFTNRCTGIFHYDEVKNHLIPEVAAALNAVMTKFNCSVCCLDNSMKDGITCRKIEQTNEENELHTFCIKCIKEFAATDEAILAHGGIGLSCMQTDCEHALMLNRIRMHLPKDVIKRLEERVLEENLGHAEIEGLQRCQKCNYAVEVIGGRYFVCVCGNKQCIKCGETFDNKHVNLDCKEKKNPKNMNLEEQINDVVVRLCHKCNLQFVKSSGCNYMKCRCGATQCYICREKNISYEHFCKCPGFQEECKCSKHCRQFADANHIDAHRIELLRDQVKSGKKVVNNKEIMQAMPKQMISNHEYETDSDDDDFEDDNDDFEDDDDEDDFENHLLNLRNQMIQNLSEPEDEAPLRAHPRPLQLARRVGPPLQLARRDVRRYSASSEDSSDSSVSLASPVLIESNSTIVLSSDDSDNDANENHDDMIDNDNIMAEANAAIFNDDDSFFGPLSQITDSDDEMAAAVNASIIDDSDSSIILSDDSEAEANPNHSDMDDDYQSAHEIGLEVDSEDEIVDESEEEIVLDSEDEIMVEFGSEDETVLDSDPEEDMSGNVSMFSDVIDSEDEVVARLDENDELSSDEDWS